MENKKIIELLTEFVSKQKQENTLLRANNGKLDKLIKIQKDGLDLLKCQKEVLNIDELSLYTSLSKNYLYDSS